VDQGTSPQTGLRELRDEERELIQFLAAGFLPQSKIERSLAGARVEDMADGGMGSIRFAGPPGRKMGRELVESVYHDVDGTMVVITVNLDTRGELFELDFWKVDFSPLKKYPKYSELDRKRKA
jgi:hypothetical protein